MATGLLSHLTATSLDEDYAHVSAQRGGGVGPTRRSRSGVLAVLVLALFGVLVATAGVQTSRTADESASSRDSLISQVKVRKAGLARRRGVVVVLRREIATAQARDLAATSEGRLLQGRLTPLGVDSGTVATHGPGITVVLDDARGATSASQQVQSPDLQKIVNGLWQVGAEAIAINGERLTSLSAIRDAGSAVTVNYRSLRRPYTVAAIGDPKTMGADLLDTAGGQAWVTLQSVGLQFAVVVKDSMVLPPAKPVTLRSARSLGGRQ